MCVFRKCEKKAGSKRQQKVAVVCFHSYFCYSFQQKISSSIGKLNRCRHTNVHTVLRPMNIANDFHYIRIVVAHHYSVAALHCVFRVFFFFCSLKLNALEKPESRRINCHHHFMYSMNAKIDRNWFVFLRFRPFWLAKEVFQHSTSSALSNGDVSAAKIRFNIYYLK